MFLQGTGKGKFDKGKGKTPFSAPKAYQVCGCHLACAVALCYSCREKGKAKLTSLSAKPPMTPTAGRCRLSERRTGVSALLIALMCNILCCNRSSATTVARQGTLQQNAQRRHDVGSSVAPPVTAWDRSHMLLLRQERHNSLTLKRQLCPLIQTQVSSYSLAYSLKTLRMPYQFAYMTTRLLCNLLGSDCRERAACSVCTGFHSKLCFSCFPLVAMVSISDEMLAMGLRAFLANEADDEANMCTNAICFARSLLRTLICVPQSATIARSMMFITSQASRPVVHSCTLVSVHDS